MLPLLLAALICFQTPQTLPKPMSSYDKFDDRLTVFTPPILVKGKLDNGIILTAIRVCPGKTDCTPKALVLGFMFTGGFKADKLVVEAIFVSDDYRQKVDLALAKANFVTGPLEGQLYTGVITREELIRIADGKDVACRANGHTFDFTASNLEDLKSIFRSPEPK